MVLRFCVVVASRNVKANHIKAYEKVIKEWRILGAGEAIHRARKQEISVRGGQMQYYERQQTGQCTALDCLRNALRVLPGYPVGSDTLKMAVMQTGDMDGLPAGICQDPRYEAAWKWFAGPGSLLSRKAPRPGRHPVRWRFWRPHPMNESYRAL